MLARVHDLIIVVDIVVRCIWLRLFMSITATTYLHIESMNDDSILNSRKQ